MFPPRIEGEADANASPLLTGVFGITNDDQSGAAVSDQHHEPQAPSGSAGSEGAGNGVRDHGALEGDDGDEVDQDVLDYVVFGFGC
jgi:hypothetical protein